MSGGASRTCQHFQDQSGHCPDLNGICITDSLIDSPEQILRKGAGALKTRISVGEHDRFGERSVETEPAAFPFRRETAEKVRFARQVVEHIVFPYLEDLSIQSYFSDSGDAPDQFDKRIFHVLRTFRLIFRQDFFSGGVDPERHRQRCGRGFQPFVFDSRHLFLLVKRSN